MNPNRPNIAFILACAALYRSRFHILNAQQEVIPGASVSVEQIKTIKTRAK